MHMSVWPKKSTKRGDTKENLKKVVDCTILLPMIDSMPESSPTTFHKNEAKKEALSGSFVLDKPTQSTLLELPKPSELVPTRIPEPTFILGGSLLVQTKETLRLLRRF